VVLLLRAGIKGRGRKRQGRKKEGYGKGREKKGKKSCPQPPKTGDATE